MNLRVFNASQTDQPTCIKLEQDGGDVNIMACRTDGSEKDLIAWFTSDGTFILGGGVSKRWGFKLTSDASIVIE